MERNEYRRTIILYPMYMKRLLSALLSIALLGSTAPSLSFAQESSENNDSPFTDVYPDHEYVDDIEYLKENNIVQGYEVEGTTENQFRADYQLNRAELTKIMIEAQFSQEEIGSCIQDKELKDWEEVYFPDVLIDDWFAQYVCVAVENDILDGYPDGTFKPAEAVNFAEAAKIIANSLGLNSEDITEEVWFKPFVKALEDRNGIPPSIRSFPKLITRGEMARMIHAAKETVQAEALSLNTLETFDIRESELPQVDSCDALIDQLQIDDQNFFDPEVLEEAEDGFIDFDTSEAGGNTAGTPAPARGESTTTQSLSTNDNKVADDFSETNVQVEGVDEADIIKNDGKYIYMIKGDTIRIVDAYPATGMVELSTITLDDENFNPSEIYVDEDQMVIIGQVWQQRSYPVIDPLPFSGAESSIARTSIWPGFDQSRMKVYVYDISDRENPTKQRSISIEGNYNNSRKVGKNVYFVINQWIPYYNVQEGQPADVMIPRFTDSEMNDEERPLVRCTGIQYFPGYQDRNYLIVAGLNIADNDSRLNRRVLLGSSQNIYASPESLYVATPHYGESIIEEEDDLIYESESTTRVYRFSLSQDEIEYQNQGVVPGNILNQFSMDESNNTFRIATTRDRYRPSEGSITDNNLYVLSTANMQVIGKIEQIAPDERIKSVRFIGNRGYMVTFETVDPLFVIDLENPRNPSILGKLKIPGWSDYLHPYDENHLIGFGREVDPAAENAERLTSEFLLGMKLSIFDVSDVSNPKETHKTVIGERGTTSELLYNHKALLFDKNKGLLAFPITITEKKDPDADPDYGNITTTFAGGIVFDVDLQNGFTEKGKVTHYEDDSAFEDSGEWFYGEVGRNIQRMLYIGEYLYSVSPDYVRAYDLEEVDPVSFIRLSGPKSDDVKYLEDDVVF